VATIDSIFYISNSEGYITEFLNEKGLAANQYLMTDILPEEAYTIL
jgi:hypothetical protein